MKRFFASVLLLALAMPVFGEAVFYSYLDELGRLIVVDDPAKVPLSRRMTIRSFAVGDYVRPKVNPVNGTDPSRGGNPSQSGSSAIDETDLAIPQPLLLASSATLDEGFSGGGEETSPTMGRMCPKRQDEPQDAAVSGQGHGWPVLGPTGAVLEGDLEAENASQAQEISSATAWLNALRGVQDRNDQIWLVARSLSPTHRNILLLQQANLDALNAMQTFETFSWHTFPDWAARARVLASQYRTLQWTVTHWMHQGGGSLGTDFLPFVNRTRGLLEELSRDLPRASVPLFQERKDFPSKGR